MSGGKETRPNVPDIVARFFEWGGQLRCWNSTQHLIDFLSYLDNTTQIIDIHFFVRCFSLGSNT